MNALRIFDSRPPSPTDPTESGVRGTRANSFGFVDLLAESLSDINARPVRLLLSVIGAVLGIGALVATIGFAQTSAVHIADQFSALAGRHAIVSPATDVTADGTPVAVTKLDWDAASRVERISGVESAAELAQLSLKGALVSSVVVNDPSAPVLEQPLIFAGSPNVVATAGGAFVSGRMFDTGHEGRADRVAVVSARAADRLGVGALSSEPAIFLGGMVYAVIGIYDDTKYAGDLQDAVIVPMSTARSDFDLTAPDQVLVRLAANSGLILAEQAPLTLAPDNPATISVVAPGGTSKLQENVQADLSVIFFVLSLLILLAGGFGIANVMMLSVMERVSEIGLRRAVGATQRQIAAQFVTEAVIIGTLGGLIGSALGVISIDIFAWVQGWSIVTNPAAALGGVVIGALVGLLAGGLPARRAARVEPVDALRGQ